jgi:hypothetical protein
MPVDSAHYGSGNGGAVYVSTGTPSFSNCTFTSNTASAFHCHVDIDGRVLTFVENTVVVLSTSTVAFQAFRTVPSPATVQLVCRPGC